MYRPKGQKVFDSHCNGIRVRGTARQVYDKYLTLAKDAFNEDRVLSERYHQHAEHYARLGAEAI
jgi:hypothetical protein